MSDFGQIAAAAGLEPVGKRPRLLSYLAGAFERRAFATTLAQYTLLASTAKSRLGVAWLVIVPALQITVYGLIFGLVLGSNRPDNFLPFLVVGVVLFQLISGSFADGAKSITMNSALVRSLNFPRVLLPISAMVSQVLKFFGLLVIALIALPILGEMPRWSWLEMFPVILLTALFSSGLAMLAARLTVHFTDLTQLIPFITRVAFYASGVFFSIEKLVAGYPVLEFMNWANPVSVYLTLGRSAMVTGYSADLTLWIAGSAWAIGTLLVGFIFFWRAEERYGRVA